MSDRHTKWAFSTVAWLTIQTWIPIALLLGLPNDWYWIILKVFVALWLLGVLRNLWFASPKGVLGPTGPGFVISGGLFAVLFFPIPDWLRYVVGGLIGLLLYPIFEGLRRMHVQPDADTTKGGERGEGAGNS